MHSVLQVYPLYAPNDAVAPFEVVGRRQSKLVKGFRHVQRIQFAHALARIHVT